MKRKGLVRLLSIVAALMLPLSAMAQGAAMDLLTQAKADGKEIVATLTFEPGATLAADQVVADLSAATAIRINKLAGGFGAFTLVLSGVDTVAAQLSVQADGLYVQSETLGDKPLFFSWEDLQKYMDEAMKSSGAGTGMAGFQQMMGAGLLKADETQPVEALTEDQIKQKITQAMGGDDSFVKWFEAIEAKKVVTKGEYTLDGSDVADTKTELTVTNADMVGLYDIAYIQKQMTAQIKAQDATLTDEQAEAKTKETVDQIKASIVKSEAVMPLVIYTSGEDNLVAVDLQMSATMQKSDGDIAYGADLIVEPTATAAEATPTPAAEVYAKYDVSLLLTKKTADAGKIYSMKVVANEDSQKVFGLTGALAFNDKVATGTLTAVNGKDEPKLVVDMNCDYTDAKHMTGDLAVTAYDAAGNNAVLLSADQTVGDASVDTALSVSYGESVEAIKADAAKSLLGTVKVNIQVKDDSGYFAALKEATPATSLEVMKLSADELQTYLGTLQGNAFQLLYKVMGNLPQSVSKLLSSTMSGN